MQEDMMSPTYLHQSGRPFATCTCQLGQQLAEWLRVKQYLLQMPQPNYLATSAKQP